MPPSIDKPSVPGGVSEPCLFNSHDECRSPRCSCSCHQPAVIEQSISVTVAGPEKACPKCGSKRPFAEAFCRIDGERLASLLCGVCGAGMNVEDSFCYNCGSPKGKVASSDKPPNGETVTVPEVDYGSQILRGLQEELDVQQGPSNGSQPVAQTVIEQPAGTQGSFKFVNKPNPNKLRGPVPNVQGAPSRDASPRPPDRRIPKLPIKPS